VLARIGPGEGTGRIVAVQHGTLLATSFHPELGADHRMHAHFVGMVQGENQRRT